MVRNIKFQLVILLLLIGFSANAKILLPQILSSNMVLQREKPINIWGYASAGEKSKFLLLVKKSKQWPIRTEIGQWFWFL